jgi:hypothetical protein
MHRKFGLGKLEGRVHVEEQDVKGRIISKYTLAINWT